MLVYVLALGSPTHPVGDERLERVDDELRPRLGHVPGPGTPDFAPLFGHQYSHVWIDFRGIQDEYMRQRGIDYFENSRRATLRAARLRDRATRWAGTATAPTSGA